MDVIIMGMARDIVIMEILGIQHMGSENIVGLTDHHIHHVARARRVIPVLALIVHLYVKQWLYFSSP